MPAKRSQGRTGRTAQRARARGKPTPKKNRDAFLTALGDGHTVSHAATVADLSRSTVYDLRASDASFAAAWDEARERGIDALEEEARRRAVDGVDKPVFQKGVLVGTIREYSDGLLLKLLQARRPGVYREHYRHEHVGRIDHRIRLDKLSDAELDALEKLMAKASE